MDVRLPDGTIVRNVPDGMTQADLMARVQRMPARMNPTIAAQGEKYADNMTPPESVMDPRDPAYKSAQQGANTLDVIGGIAGMGVGGILKPGAGALRWGAEKLMRSAVKPSTVEDPAKVRRAIATALDSKSGGLSGLNMESVRERGGELGAQVDALLTQNPGAIPMTNLGGYGDDLLGKLRYTNQTDDLAAARGARQQFLSGETFGDLGKRERALTEQVMERNASAQGALQDAGRFATQRAKMEVGGQKWYPVEGMPRAPYRYSPHAEQVPAATGAMNDALVIVKQRQREAESARKTLDSLPPSEREGMLPLEQAQAMKQALYAKLGDRAYGAGLKPMADRDMTKALAQGLRRDIEALEPGVVPLNAEAGDLWNLHNVAGRGVAAAQNKNPIGMNLGMAVSNPLGAGAFAMDRSQLVKALMARGLNNSQRAPGIAIGAALGSNMSERK